MTEDKSIPPILVIKAIRVWLGDKADKAIEELKYDSLCDYWYLPNWNGMYVGIERDGYIHS